MIVTDVTSTSLTKASGLGTSSMPTRLYTDPAHYDLEVEQVFRRAWLKVGRVEQIPLPGDFFVKKIEMFSASIVITRSKNGEVRALHNVCSHRGNHVVLQEKGNASLFTCRYHSWTFRNTGELVGVTDPSGFFNLDKAKCGLTLVAVDVWDGWIFINMQPKPEVSLLEFLGPLADALAGIAYPHPENAIILTGEFKANWKAVADAFSESYHLSSIHPKTLAPVYAGRDNPYSRPVSANIYGAHRSFSTWLNTSYQTPEKAKVERWIYPVMETITGTRKEGEVNPLVEHPGINPSKSETWASDATWVFPNWNLQISANRFWNHEIWPTSVNTTRWEGRFYLPVATSVRERIQLEHFTAQMTDAMLEDLSNIERTQEGMESGAKPFLILQDSEILIRHNLETIVKWCAATSVTAALNS